MYVGSILTLESSFDLILVKSYVQFYNGLLRHLVIILEQIIMCNYANI